MISVRSKGISSTPPRAKQYKTISLCAVCSCFHLPVEFTTHTIPTDLRACPDPPPTVRLLTPKVTRASATVTKSKGCAFLEFSTRPALQAALKLHQSELDGRRINVELTAGGGGKGDTRLTKVKARNKQLTAQRVRPIFFNFPCMFITT
jgi:RNA recognition motif-containing protein